MVTPTYKNLDILIEQPESGRVESADSRTITKIYRAKYSVCVAAIKFKGTLGSGSLLGYEIRSSSVERERGDLGRLTDVWSAGGDDADPETTPLPQDEVAITANNLSPRLERHLKYSSLTAAEFQKVDDAVRAPNASQRDAIKATLSTLGRELVDKITKGNESYYLATLRYSWVTHSYTVPNSTRGGYIDTIAGSPLAGYFLGTISWLREADNLEYSNGIWRLTRSWIGADAWDSDLY